MKVLLYLSELMIPFLVFYIVGCGLAMKTPVYDSFIRGAGIGLKTAVKLVPTLIGLIVATGVLRASGFLELLAGVIGQLLPASLLPPALAPLGIVKLFSSSAATGLLLDIYKQYGTDSMTGLAASLMLSSTETVFYTMSVYYMSIGVKKTRHTLCGALLASLAGIMASVALARQMTG